MEDDILASWHRGVAPTADSLRNMDIIDWLVASFGNLMPCLLIHSFVVWYYPCLYLPECHSGINSRLNVTSFDVRPQGRRCYC